MTMTDQNDIPNSPLRALTARYAPDTDADQPHRLVLSLAGFNTIFSFDTIKQIQEFVHGAQSALGYALGQAIENAPMPAQPDEITEKFLEDTMACLEDIKGELNEVPIAMNFSLLRDQIDNILEYADEGDVDARLETRELEYLIDSLHGELHDKHEKIYEQRRALEAERKAQQEARELALQSERAGHEAGDHTIQ